MIRPPIPSLKALALLLLAPLAPALAGTDGQLGAGAGATSSGSLRVGLVVRDMVRLSGVDDLMLDWNEADQRFTASDGLCVYRNLSGDYSVKASSTRGGSDGYRLAGPDDSSLSYNVSWQGRELNAGTRTATLSDAHATAMDCDGGDNVTLAVSASGEQAAQASASGLHTDTLVLEIIAE